MAFAKRNKLRVSLIRQRDISDCGAACLASICGFYGLYVPVSRIRQYAQTDQKGTSVYGIVEAASRMNLLAKGMKSDYESLRYTTLPAIVHVIVNDRLAHYYVLVSAGAKSVVVMDPAIGKLVKISRKIFCQSWTGVIVLIIPADKFIGNTKKSVARRVCEIGKNFKRSIVYSSVFAAIVSALGLSVSVYVREIIDNVIPAKNLTMANILSAVVIGVLIVQFITSLIKTRLILKTGIDINRLLVKNYVDHVLQLPVSFYRNMRVGEIMSRINDAVKISAFVNDVAINVVVDALIIIFSLALMFIFNWKIALMIVTIVPVYGALFYIGRRLNKKRQRKLAEAGAVFESTMVESLQSAISIRHLRLETYSGNKCNQSLQTVLNLLQGYSSRQMNVQMTADFVTKIFSVVLLWIGACYVVKDQMTAGELISFFTLLGYFTGPVLFLLNASKEVGEARVAAERLFEIMDLEKAAYGNRCEPNSPLVIELNNVQFGYKHGTRVLKGVNLIIRSGSITGIKGESGSGKSTLVSLLMGDEKPQNGTITINGVDLSDMNKEAIGNVFCVAGQIPALFTGTIADNIVLNLDRDQVKLSAISERLGINSFADELKGGINAHVTEGGLNLSVGQRQRICLARAIYRNAPVLILDEATTAVDAESEKKIMQTIESYKNGGNAVIIISHSDATLKICDNIAVLENGQIR
jgi:ATP-binding cassette subfamily B protein